VTPAPTATRRRGQAAAGAQPPRRPRAARSRTRRTVTATVSGAATAALAALAAACAALAGCAAAPAAKPATSAANATTAASVFTVTQHVSLPQLKAEISDLDRSHPAVASFEAQGVQYTAASRANVLRECTSAGAGAGSQDAETSQVIACAPLIFFYYSYGKQDSVPAAITVAGGLYWYAVTHVTGPESARTSLDELLQSWKLPVPGLTAAQQNTVVATSVINAADDSMLTQKGVHLVITDQAASAASGKGGANAGPTPAAAAQRIVADIGTVTGTETITDGTTNAAIRITSKAAYFTGDPTGLTAYLGLSQKSADKVASRWVAIKAGTTEYQALAAENTIASVPPSLLPSAADAVQVRTATIDGRKTYVLTWKAAASGSSPAYSAELILTVTPQILPVSETIATSGASKTVTFSRWGSPFTVTPPASVIPYSQVSG
jgi:hypothetical protein